MIFISILWLVADYIWKLTSINFLLILPMILLLIGVFLHVFFQKRESNY